VRSGHREPGSEIALPAAKQILVEAYRILKKRPPRLIHERFGFELDETDSLQHLVDGLKGQLGICLCLSRIHLGLPGAVIRATPLPERHTQAA
jgi:hypothetical protein